MKKRVFAGLLAVLLFVAGCATRRDQEVLVVGLLPDIDSVPFAVAYLRGYFDESIELQVFMGPTFRDSALFGGVLDASISDAMAVALARNGGFDAFLTFMTNGRKGILTMDDEIRTAADLEGREVGMSLGTIIDYIVDRAVIAHGGDPYAVEKVSVPAIASRLELLVNRQICAIAVPDPFVAAAVARGARVVADSYEMGIAPEVILMTRNALENKQDQVWTLIQGYNRAVAFINANEPSAFMPGVIDFLALPDEAMYVALPLYNEATAPCEYEVLAAIDWLLMRGMIDEPFTYEDLLWPLW